jgi:hypothetical protein
MARVQVTHQRRDRAIACRALVTRNAQAAQIEIVLPRGVMLLSDRRCLPFSMRTGWMARASAHRQRTPRIGYSFDKSRWAATPPSGSIGQSGGYIVPAFSAMRPGALIADRGNTGRRLVEFAATGSPVWPFLAAHVTTAFRRTPDR